MNFPKSTVGRNKNRSCGPAIKLEFYDCEWMWIKAVSRFMSCSIARTVAQCLCHTISTFILVHVGLLCGKKVWEPSTIMVAKMVNVRSTWFWEAGSLRPLCCTHLLVEGLPNHRLPVSPNHRSFSFEVKNKVKLLFLLTVLPEWQKNRDLHNMKNCLWLDRVREESRICR